MLTPEDSNEWLYDRFRAAVRVTCKGIAFVLLLSGASFYIHGLEDNASGDSHAAVQDFSSAIAAAGAAGVAYLGSREEILDYIEGDMSPLDDRGEIE